MHISIIVAAAENGVIGKDNQLLWRLPDDLKRFKQLTLNHPMIMGRKTFESIGKPLPGRTSIVISRNKAFAVEGVLVCDSVETALDEAKKLESDEVFIIGGGEIYRQAQSLADRIYLTAVHAQPDGDTFFEIENPDAWVATAATTHTEDDRHELKFDFIDYVRRE